MKLHPDILASPYFLYAKIGLAVIAAGTLIALVWSWHSRGQDVERLESWQTTVVTAVSNATVEKGKRLKPEDVPAAVATLKSNLDEARSALDVITRQAAEAKQRSDQNDAALEAQLREAEKRYAGAKATITKLESRRPAASPGEAAAAISEDSKAAWQGWR